MAAQLRRQLLLVLVHTMRHATNLIIIRLQVHANVLVKLAFDLLLHLLVALLHLGMLMLQATRLRHADVLVRLYQIRVLTLGVTSVLHRLNDFSLGHAVLKRVVHLVAGHAWHTHATVGQVILVIIPVVIQQQLLHRGVVLRKYWQLSHERATFLRG